MTSPLNSWASLRGEALGLKSRRERTRRIVGEWDEEGLVGTQEMMQVGEVGILGDEETPYLANGFEATAQ